MKISKNYSILLGVLLVVGVGCILLIRKTTLFAKPAASIPVLLYHGEGGAAANTPVGLFADQMKTLKGNGWHTITLSQFRAFMKDGKKLPEKSFLLTFDDGRKDTYKAVDRILQKDGFSAVMFVITGFSMPDNGSASNFYLSKDELSTMAKSGRWELEAHTKEGHYIYGIAPSGLAAGSVGQTGVYNASTSPRGIVPGHFLSNKFTVLDVESGQSRLETDSEFRARIKNDLSLTNQTLENNFGKPVIAFAYPYSDFGQNTINFPRAAKTLANILPSLYQFAFYQGLLSEGETFNYPNPNTFMIRRIEPGLNWDGQTLMQNIKEGMVKNLPYKSSNFGGEWLLSWGVSTTSPSGALSLSAEENDSGAEASLAGSHLWTNYRLTAKVDIKSGSEVSLLARRIDAKNYISCDFSKTKIFLEKHIGGNMTEVSSIDYTLPQDKSSLTLSMIVDGPSVECIPENSTLSVKAGVDESVLQTGGVGLQIWDEGLGVARADFNSVDIEPI